MIFNLLMPNLLRVSIREQLALQYRQLALLLASGMTAHDAIDTLKQACRSRRVRGILNDIQSAVSAPSSGWGEAVISSRYVNPAFVYLIKKQGVANEISAFLNDMADELEDSANMIRRVRHSLSYPMISFGIAIMLTLVILVFVIPVFQDMFFGFGRSLPAPTQWVIRISEFVETYIAFIIPGLLVLWGIGYKFRRWVIVAMSFFPVLGTMFRNLSVLQFLRYLSVLTQIKLPLNEAVLFASAAVDNPVFAQKLRKMADEALGSDRFKDAMIQSGLFPSVVIQAVDVGEQTLSLGGVLPHICGYYEKQFNSWVFRYATLTDVFFILLVGFLIGGLVIAMYLPIFQMASVVG